MRDLDCNSSSPVPKGRSTQPRRPWKLGAGPPTPSGGNLEPPGVRRVCWVHGPTTLNIRRGQARSSHTGRLAFAFRTQATGAPPTVTLLRDHPLSTRDVSALDPTRNGHPANHQG